MEITRVGKFQPEEIEALQKAGTILGSTARALSEEKVDILSEESAALIAALKEVIERI